MTDIRDMSPAEIEKRVEAALPAMTFRPDWTRWKTFIER